MRILLRWARSINPLFEIEFRGRWRRPWTWPQIAGVVFLGALLLGWLIYSAPQADGLTVVEARAQGWQILGAYRLWGGALYFLIGLLVGAMSILSEKNSGTFEHLLLCPLGARAIVVGKALSSLAFLLVAQFALLPLLVLMGLICLLTPGQIVWVVVMHLCLSAQGVTLGILGAVRAKSIGAAVGNALLWWGIAALQFVTAVFMVPAVLFTVYAFGIFARQLLLAFGLRLSGLAFFYGVWNWFFIDFLLPLGIGIGVVLSGVFGVGALVDSKWLTPLVLIGQCLGVLYFARWGAWQLHSPGRVMVAMTAQTQTSATSFLKPFFTDWNWQLSPAQIARFPVLEADAPPLAAPLQIATTAKNARRLRLLKTRWMQNLNPVLWLDLQRCLSLRAPHPAAQVPLLLASALGGALALAASMATLVSLLAGGADAAQLGELFAVAHQTLCYGALASGPLFATTGYVIERRSMMLHELRLTLLSARGLWWGKFAARWCIPLVFALPGLALAMFFADNMGEAAPAFAVLGEACVVAAIAAWSVLGCLWLSYHAPNTLAAALWTLAFASIWGGALWPSGARLWAPLSMLSPLSASSVWLCALIHGALAMAAGASIWWKLKRMGFG